MSIVSKLFGIGIELVVLILFFFYLRFKTTVN